MNRTSETHPIDVFWVERSAYDGSGRIGLTFAPGKHDVGMSSGIVWKRSLITDLNRLRYHHGVDVLISLLEPFEYDMLNIPNLFDEACARGIEVVHFPIVDGQVPRPDQAKAVASLIGNARDAVGNGKSVVIHCRAGLGRTGTVAAMLLATYGHDAESAVAAVRRVQPGAVETHVQHEYIGQFVGNRAP